MLHGALHLAGMDHETDSGEMAQAEVRWRKRLGLPDGLIERQPAMTLLFLVLDAIVAIIVTLATTIQVLYLESLRIRARELPSLEFFKSTLEAKIGLETELGALTFSLVKHLGLAVLGCLTLALTAQNAADWEALDRRRPAGRVFCDSRHLHDPAGDLSQEHADMGCCRWFRCSV